MLIKDRVIKIGPLSLVWDWFEACKWLSFFSGWFGLVSMGCFLVAYSGVSNMDFVLWGIGVFSFMLMFVCGGMVNVIRSSNLK